jgi:hypothetical protein
MSFKKLAIIAGILLLLAIPPIWPYGYYIFLRWVIFIVSIIVAWGFYKSKLTAWTFIFGAIAFLFNPIAPIHLTKSNWITIDLASSIFFFLAAYSAKKKT